MTDGILLAEIQRDRELRRYDTLIIDEAHERSLNIDFLLGYLKQLLPRRPDLKVVVTSATIDPERFAEHFGDAPVVEVSGRTYPVEVRYRPVVDPDAAGRGRGAATRPRRVLDAVDELLTEPGGRRAGLPLRRAGDPGHRRRAAPAPARLREPVEVLPLYARLSAAEQHRVFAAHDVPAGRARHQRRGDLAHGAGHPVRRRPGHRPDLALQPPAQGAAAADRAGLAGVRQPAGRPVRAHLGRHLHPAVLRGGLPRPAGVHRARDPAHQPGLGHPADDRARAGRHRRLPVRRARPTAGRSRTAWPCSRSSAPSTRRSPTCASGSPRSAAGSPSCRSTRGSAGWCWRPTATAACREVLVIAAALSIQDPRERPPDQQQAARRAAPPVRRRPVGLPRLPQPLALPAGAADGAVLQRVPPAVPGRVPALPAGAGVAGPRRPAAPGLPVARTRDHRRAVGTRRRPAAGAPVAAARAAVPHRSLRPGEARVPRRPRRPVRRLAGVGAVPEAAALGDGRRAGRDLAAVGPRRSAGSSRSGSSRSPSTWSSGRTASRTGGEAGRGDGLREGDPVRRAAGRRPQGRLRPHRPGPLPRAVHPARAGARASGAPTTASSTPTATLLEEVEELEHRARRRDILVDDETLVDFYDQRLPAEVVSARHFDAWWKNARREQPDLLTFDPDMLVRDEAGRVSTSDYPDDLDPGRARAAR